MKTMTIDCTPELSVALGKRGDEVEKEVLLSSALKLFELGRISSGLAARLAGMSRVQFLILCGQYGVSVFQQSVEDLNEDLSNALEASE